MRTRQAFDADLVQSSQIGRAGPASREVFPLVALRDMALPGSLSRRVTSRCGALGGDERVRVAEQCRYSPSVQEQTPAARRQNVALTHVQQTSEPLTGIDRI